MAELVAEEAALVEAASQGDQEAFRKLVEPISRELHLFPYRMLRSFQDAEDVLQEYEGGRLDAKFASLNFPQSIEQLARRS